MKVIDVANFFITVGSYNEGSEMTNARINKLLYFAQGRHLATYGKPLFDEKIEAWKFGPIIEEIYHSFKSYGNNIITKTKGEFDIEEMDEIGYEDYFYGEGLCMIEWANLIEEILPPVRKDIVIEKDLDKGFDYRKITITEVG